MTDYPQYPDQNPAGRAPRDQSSQPSDQTWYGTEPPTTIAPVPPPTPGPPVDPYAGTAYPPTTPYPSPPPAAYPPVQASYPAPQVYPPISAQPYSGQPYSGQPYSGQPYSGQPYPAQQYATQPYAAQVVVAAPFGVDPVTGHPLSDKTKVVAGLLQLLPGFVFSLGGIGRLYAGNTVIGVLQIVASVVGWTMFWCGFALFLPFFVWGGIWLWFVIDGIVMLAGRPVDGQGRLLRS